jgi:hypothetical protein
LDSSADTLEPARALPATHPILHTTIKHERSSDEISISSSDSTDDETQQPAPKPLRVKREPSIDVISISSDQAASDNDRPSPGVSYEYPIEVETTVVLPLWPRRYYAVDINAGFISMENARKSGRSVKEAFTRVFGDVPYRSQTVSDHRMRWQQAGPTARAAFIEAGCTPAGLWSAFMAAYPAKGAAEKAAKKRLARAL